MYTYIYIVIYVYIYVSIYMYIRLVSTTTMTTLSFYPVNTRAKEIEVKKETCSKDHLHHHSIFVPHKYEGKKTKSEVSYL